jgi:CelD/BcsL family acetyltransferase involved in cellulose biosynthesis
MTLTAQVPEPEAGALRVRVWRQEEFAASRDAWDALVAVSDADPLFMSWDWQWRWWVHHGSALRATPWVVAVYEDCRLVGLAPFYSRSVLVRGLLRLRRVELIGTAWRDPRAAFSDYLDLIVARPIAAAVCRRIAEWLHSQLFWDELVLCCTKRDSTASSLVQNHLRVSTHIREVDELHAWFVRLPKTFDQFLRTLSADVRRKLFNQRSKIVAPEVQQAHEAEIAEFLHELWRHSGQRWGDPYAGSQAGNYPSAEFHVEFAACMARAGRLRLSRLRTGETTLSVMYNVRVGDAVYYLQSGFDAVRSRGFSPGYLHFGYAIQAACEENANRFDFLAGPGRRRDYKRDFASEPVRVVTYHVVRAKLARALYAVYEVLMGWRYAPRLA